MIANDHERRMVCPGDRRSAWRSATPVWRDVALGPLPSTGRGRQALLQSIEADAVLGHDAVALVPRHANELLVEESPGFRPAAVEVREIGGPHDALDADRFAKANAVAIVDEGHGAV